MSSPAHASRHTTTATLCALLRIPTNRHVFGYLVVTNPLNSFHRVFPLAPCSLFGSCWHPWGRSSFLFMHRWYACRRLFPASHSFPRLAHSNGSLPWQTVYFMV